MYCVSYYRKKHQNQRCVGSFKHPHKTLVLRHVFRKALVVPVSMQAEGWAANCPSLHWLFAMGG